MVDEEIAVIDAVVLSHDFRNILLACEAFLRAAIAQRQKDLEILEAFKKAQKEAGIEESESESEVLLIPCLL